MSGNMLGLGDATQLDLVLMPENPNNSGLNMIDQRLLSVVYIQVQIGHRAGRVGLTIISTLDSFNLVPLSLEWGLCLMAQNGCVSASHHVCFPTAGRRTG